MGWMEVKCVRSSDADTKRGNEKKKKIRLFWRHEGQTDRQQSPGCRRDNEQEKRAFRPLALPVAMTSLSCLTLHSLDENNQ